MVQKIPPHSHCKVCGKAIPEGKIYCSRACREKDEAEQRKAKRMMIVYFVLLFSMVVFFIIISYISSTTA